jgi:hypothetical protein
MVKSIISSLQNNIKIFPAVEKTGSRNTAGALNSVWHSVPSSSRITSNYASSWEDWKRNAAGALHIVWQSDSSFK